jgi:hypothetical protein
MYQFKDTINYNSFFRFDKNLILNKIWASLPLSSKAIYPVIGVHCNAKGVAYPSERTIAILTGCAEKTVREGLKGLSALIGIEHKVTNRGHFQNIYHYPVPPIKKGRVFFFHKAIILGGNWQELDESAQALYPVMKHFSFLDFEEYDSIEYEESLDRAYLGDYADAYSVREYDFCNADIEALAEYAGIGRSTTYEAIRSLENKNLIAKTDPLNFAPTWKVFIIPPKYFKTEYLNEKISSRYRNASTR